MSSEVPRCEYCREAPATGLDEWQSYTCGLCAAEMERINRSTLVAQWLAFRREVISILRVWFQ